MASQEQASRPRDKAGSGTQTYTTLTIEKRVLITPSRTIAIRNIANITIGTNVEERSQVPLWGSIFFLTIAILVFVASRNSPSGIAPALIISGFFVGLALVCFIRYRMQLDKTHFLIVSSNDGVRSLFKGPNRKILEDVRRILSEKMNASDESSAYDVNFETDSVSPLSSGTTQNNAPSAQGKIPASPDAPVGSKIDCASFLPQLDEWQQFYAGHQETRELAEKLSQLTALLRAGTLAPADKDRARNLTKELRATLQGFPPAVELFSEILARLG